MENRILLSYQQITKLILKAAKEVHLLLKQLKSGNEKMSKYVAQDMIDILFQSERQNI